MLISPQINDVFISIITIVIIILFIYHDSNEWIHLVVFITLKVLYYLSPKFKPSKLIEAYKLQNAASQSVWETHSKTGLKL